MALTSHVLLSELFQKGPSKRNAVERSPAPAGAAPGTTPRPRTRPRRAERKHSRPRNQSPSEQQQAPGPGSDALDLPAKNAPDRLYLPRIVPPCSHIPPPHNPITFFSQKKPNIEQQKRTPGTNRTRRSTRFIDF